MRHTKFSCFFSRSLLGSALLTLIILSFSSSAFGFNNDNNNRYNSASPYWKRSPQEPQARRPHSPYTEPNIPPSSDEQFQNDSGDASGTDPASPAVGSAYKRRSLFPHINYDMIVELKQQLTNQQQPSSEKEDHHVSPSGTVASIGEPEINEKTPLEEDLDFWGQDEERTLVDAHYPSIDLFDAEDEELFELGEDGILRAVTRGDGDGDEVENGDEDERHRRNRINISLTGSIHDEDEERHDQVWMVDEWEEELEGDMDELMDWVDDNEDLINHLPKPKSEKPLSAMVMGSQRPRDRESLINSALRDEDEASPFQRLFSESWLF
ncbi:hypothetical protein BX616_006195 [Lobosporangium transversale]|uniref:Uncharacterized protein n=1 Tax=Lobosporangium transversale TaxID=64571 RepID=A0A1Y2G8T4_9FUNG|nr:hypothetical protein BCR41DRAFT_401751 [Lobosporangium transversale]KAF9897091.1 hypothetical protein BX616_006195 [Lobosporangium transversale]ORY99619.1 hypothetical protein BCR41DRAFT_401751 [Lobosporangium transversale]|eukprot:XP_021875914.1 hypothetical protein BCR41DRAFT_401751 [Lobosporangium transversale]